MLNKKPDVSICIINHRGKEDTLDCLRSIREDAKGVSLEVIVIENASQDGCAEAIRQEFPRVHLVQNSAPQSFTVNNNLAIQHSSGRYVLVLNNDTLVQDNALDTLVHFMDEHTECGAATAKLIHPDGSVQHVPARTPTLWTYAYRVLVSQNLSVVSAAWRRRLSAKSDYREITETDNICGACMLVRRQVIDQVGAFDPGYDFYFEDVDWSYRIRQAGWRLYVVPQAQIVHFGGASLRQVRARAKIQEFKSALRFFTKHGTSGAAARAALKGIWLIASTLRLYAYSFLALSGKQDAKQSAAAYLRVLVWHIRPIK